MRRQNRRNEMRNIDISLPQAANDSLLARTSGHPMSQSGRQAPDAFPVSGHSAPKAIRLTLDFPSTTASTYGTRSRGMPTASQSNWRCKPRDLRAAQSLGHNVTLIVSAGLSCKDSKTLQ